MKCCSSVPRSTLISNTWICFCCILPIMKSKCPRSYLFQKIPLRPGVFKWMKYFLPNLSVSSEGVPQKTIFPLFKIAMRSHKVSTSAISWLAKTIVLPCDLSFRICSWRDSLPSTSSPAVGSSRKIISGLLISARARCNLLF